MGKCLHGELTDGVLRPLTCSFMRMIYVKVQWRQTCTNPVAEVRETAPVLHEIEILLKKKINIEVLSL